MVLFKDNTTLVFINLHSNSLKALPLGLFDGLSELVTLPLQYNKFTTRPAGIFAPLPSLVNMYFHGYDHQENMQSISESTATNIRLAANSIAEGTCGCTPYDAVSCPGLTVCTPGTKGCTCEPTCGANGLPTCEPICSNGLPGYNEREY